MRRILMAAVTGMLLASLAGCAAITGPSLLMKGAQWAAGEVVKKEIKHLRKHKEKPASRPSAAQDERN